jgi:hypothetical protein
MNLENRACEGAGATTEWVEKKEVWGKKAGRGGVNPPLD